MVVENALRLLMVRKIDQLWQEHLLTMDHLRHDVSLRAVGQKDPLLEFKHEAFILFDKLHHSLHKQIAQDLFRFEILTHDHLENLNELFAGLRLETSRSFLEEMEKGIYV